MKERARARLIGLLEEVPPIYRLARRMAIVAEQVLVVRRYEPGSQPLAAIRHVLTNRETANFTYEIDNVDELTEFLATALQHGLAATAQLVDEIERDRELEASLNRKLAARVDRNNSAPYGRRIGWYVTTRVTKPKLAVETGTHDGLGSSVILRALERNASEGAPGRLISVDVDPSAGWLIPDSLRANFEQRFEDSIEALRSIGDAIDLAVVDSAHAYQHERTELETIAAQAHAGTIVISDNPGSRAFADFCAARGFVEFEFRERPRRHIHPGAGLALTRLSVSTPDATP